MSADARYDIAVIGAGYVGMPHAQTFAEAGKKVVLVDVLAARRRRDQPRREPHRGRPLREAEAARRVGRDRRDHRLLRGRRRRRHRDRGADAAVAPARAGPLATSRAPPRSIGAPPPRRATSSCSSRPRIRARPARSLQPLLEEGSGLKAGGDFHLAFAPERVDPGREDFTTRTTPKVVGGIDQASTEAAARALPGRGRRRPQGLDRRGGRADEAAREHLPLGQHRARQRARAALRPDGDRRAGRSWTPPRRSRSASCRSSPARASAATASRSTPSTSPGRRASTTSTRGSSSSPARSTTTCRTSAAR